MQGNERNEAKTKKTVNKKLKVQPLDGLVDQTLTQMFTEDGKRKKKATKGKKGKVKSPDKSQEVVIPTFDCEYEIPMFEGAPYEAVSTPTHDVDEEFVKPVGILTSEKGKVGWQKC